MAKGEKKSEETELIPSHRDMLDANRQIKRQKDELERLRRQNDGQLECISRLTAVNAALQAAAAAATATVQVDGEAAQVRFERLAAEWGEETGMLSSVREKAMHPAYQRIIGMGWEAVPLMLGELAREPDHWFWALRAITGANPVPPDDRGKVKKMAEAWVAWGRDQGHLK